MAVTIDMLFCVRNNFASWLNLDCPKHAIFQSKFEVSEFTREIPLTIIDMLYLVCCYVVQITVVQFSVT